ncbi:membrane protein [Cellulomonas carbonis]|uniref:Thioredoxin domain-containing protein n=1 Tax=Cellulomonas carbonis T26 TaxID=947969 RepID=A0A0A0BN50_9CELL|nr:hypothetical protein N868_02340 [Cellulomonas carbonis T26]GGC04580.1 membrane protein [Cellulomonas carbonis]
MHRTARVLLLLVASLALAAAPAAALQPAGPTPSVAAPVAATATADDDVTLVRFTGEGCPRCREQSAWLEDAASRYPGLTVVEHEVWRDAANRALFVRTGEELGFEASSVPTTVLGGRVWIGWTDEIAADLEAALDDASAGRSVPAGVYGTPGSGTCDDASLTCEAGAAASVDVPLIGEVDLGRSSLLASTLAIGFVDGINPCSLWAVSVLLTIVVRTASRRRVVAVGTTFLLVTAGMYALYMAGIYSALTVASHLGAIQAVVAVVAGVVGVVGIKDYFAFRKGVSLSIADSAKPGLYRRMRAAAGADRLVPALLATVALAVAVSLLETPCTAGFPVLWTGLLQANGVGPAEAAGLFGAYMVPFLLDELAVFGLAVVTMRATRMQERHGRLLKLVAGVTMVALAAVMVVDPTVMESPVAALGVFAGAIALTVVVHAVTTRLRTRAARVRGAVAPGGVGGPAQGGVRAGSGPVQGPARTRDETSATDDGTTGRRTARPVGTKETAL